MYLRVLPFALALSLASGLMTTAYLNQKAVTPVAEALRRAPGPDLTTLRGRLTEIGPNRYVLEDESGRIRLNLCPPWYRRIVALPTEDVTVQGTLAEPRRWLLGRPSFDVYVMEKKVGREVLRTANYVPWARRANRVAIAEWRDWYAWEHSLPSGRVLSSEF